MNKIFFVALLLIFVNGCFQLTPQKIIKNPDLVIKECNEFETSEEIMGCFMKFAKDVSLISKETSVKICENLESGYGRNRCLFGVFSNLENNGRLNEGIEVCKQIDKKEFLKWCENRKSGESIVVAPSLS